MYPCHKVKKAVNYPLSLEKTRIKIIFMLSRLFKRKRQQKKVSEMLLNVAGDFIAMGEDIAEKQELLNASVRAWNIACLKDDKRQRAINKFMKEYIKLNPTFTKDDFKDEEENLRLLIRQKDELYPDINIQIVNAIVQEVDGKNHITVASAKME